MVNNDRLFSIRRTKSNRKHKLITFYKPINVRNPDRGTIEKKWLKEFTAKAYVRQVGASEYTEYNLDIDYEDRIFMINHRLNINPEAMILYKGERYYIKKIDTFEDNRRDDILILATTSVTVE